jgi:hypothetical protein
MQILYMRCSMSKKEPYILCKIAKCFIPLNVADVLSCGFYKRKEEKNNA